MVMQISFIFLVNKSQTLTKMKRIILVCFMVVSTITAIGQYNPYVSVGIVTPAPLQPVEFNGTGVLSFNIANLYSAVLPVSKGQMGMIITLSYGIPDNVDPLAALGGTWKDKFDWVYDAGINTYTATQNQDLPGNYEVGTITIQYRVTINTPEGSKANGFNVNIQPAAYMNGNGQLTEDDQVSFFTWV